MTVPPDSREISRQPEQRFIDRYLKWFERWMPESFVICLALTLIVGVLALTLTDSPLWSPNPETTSVVGAWSSSMWDLLAFTMQMTVLLATGHAVATSPPATKALSRVASLPRSRSQVLIMAVVATGLLGFIHWGLGMMGGIVIGKELLAQARLKGIRIHKPTLVGASFLGFLPAAAGMSGAAVLYAATPNYLKDLVPDQYKDRTPTSIPLSDTVVRPDFIALLALCMVASIVFVLLMHPKDDKKIVEADSDFIAEIEAGKSRIVIERKTPAQRANASRIIMYVVGIIGLAISVYTFASQGIAALNLNTFNFLFLTLGITLCAHWGPEYYAERVRDGIMSTWGFILQYPFYAGIFGMISATGLGLVISKWFTAISTVHTWPVIAFLYSGILNIAVPSGGSKFIIEAPYIVPTTLDLNSNLGLIMQAYQMGDATTNLIIPFFALPFLTNFKLKFSQVVGFTVPPVLFFIVVTCIYLFGMSFVR